MSRSQRRRCSCGRVLLGSGASELEQLADPPPGTRGRVHGAGRCLDLVRIADSERQAQAAGRGMRLVPGCVGAEMEAPEGQLRLALGAPLHVLQGARAAAADVGQADREQAAREEKAVVEVERAGEALRGARLAFLAAVVRARHVMDGGGARRTTGRAKGGA